MLLVHVPDVRGELPLPAHLPPHDGIFAGDLLRRLRFCLEAERADFARRPGPERLDIDGRQLGVAELLHRAAQNLPIALCPFGLTAPAGSPNRSCLYNSAKALPIPLFEAATHSC